MKYEYFNSIAHTTTNSPQKTTEQSLGPMSAPVQSVISFQMSCARRVV